MQKTCDQIVMQDLVVERLGSETPAKEFIEDLYEKAKERMTEEVNQFSGLVMVALVWDKRLNYFTLGFFASHDAEVFAVPYGKAVRKGRVDALSKIISAKFAEIKKMPPLQPWPLTMQKEFVVFTYSFPWKCKSCYVFRFACLYQPVCMI